VTRKAGGGDRRGRVGARAGAMRWVIVVSEELETQLRGTARTNPGAPLHQAGPGQSSGSLVVGTAGHSSVFASLRSPGVGWSRHHFFGLAVIGLSLRGARGIGGIQRRFGPGLLGELIETLVRSRHSPGFLVGWLRSALSEPDRLGRWLCGREGPVWPSSGIFTAVQRLWFDAFTCSILPWARRRRSQPPEFGLVQSFPPPGVLLDREPRVAARDGPSSAPA